MAVLTEITLMLTLITMVTVLRMVTAREMEMEIQVKADMKTQ